MTKKKLSFRVITLLLSLVLISINTNAFAALLAFETQYEYDAADTAWLTDLVIKEDMATVEGLAGRTDLIAKPDYPYTETPESFAEDVKYYCSLYSLDENAMRSSSLFFFTVLATQAGNIAGDVSDGDIRIYLESLGITYPEKLTEEELIVARALYIAMATGVFSSFTKGASLEEVLTDYLITASGLNRAELEQWMPDGSVLSFDVYFRAAARLALWTNGYDVTPDTDDDTVASLMAYMTLESMGIESDSSLSFNELKYRYMAAMLGAKYGVRADADELEKALDNGSAAFYVLQLIGQKASLALKEDSVSYEEAFELVAQQTGAFDIEAGEFYADIPDYEVKLDYRRSSIWIYPTAYVTNNDAYLVTVTVDGMAVRNNYYSEIALDKTLAEQTLVIRVVSVCDGGTSEFEYRVKVIQGTEEYDPGSSGENENPFLSSDSVVSQILSAFGLESYFSDFLGDSRFTAVSDVVLNTVNFIAPTFIAPVFTGFEGASFIVSDPADVKFITVLDQLGELSDAVIKGIGGMDLGVDAMSFGEVVTFN